MTIRLVIQVSQPSESACHQVITLAFNQIRLHKP